MRLKSLELVGFKSFLEPTTIAFSPGMTAVVGPNGCGKSNVMDAIRWVLGEQAPTRLRGKSTEDLIFAGNDSSPAAGMAEVSLILEAQENGNGDSADTLPEPYAALSEVAVTRRVYRSGESEYLINRIPCRLKDISEFFMATQIHSRGYALIEQGRIEEIIQAKPAELRALVEEAAGLTLFKGRREISERKLERVKENLARIDDVLSEIERQLSFARRQAKKAEAYKQIKVELVELERLSAARRLFDQGAELERQSAREAELKTAAAAAREAVAKAEAEADSAQAALQAANDRLGAAARELESLDSQAAERARARGFLERRLKAIAAAEPELRARLEEIAHKATAARAARAEAGARMAREAREAADDGGEADLKNLAERGRAAEAALKDSEQRAEELKDQLSETVREAAVMRGRLGDLAGERAELNERLEQGGRAEQELGAALERERCSLSAAEATFAAAREQLARLEAADRAAAENVIAARAAADTLGAKVAALQEAAEAERRARRLTGPRNSAGARLKTVLESLNGDRPAAAPAMLHEVIKAPAELAAALNAVLGDSLEAVIVESPRFALRAIEILKEKKGGRLSFIPEPPAAALDSHPSMDAPGIAGRLLDMVEVDARFRAAAEVTLGHVMVADNLRAALAASNLNGHGSLFVTREGDLVSPGRLIAGGSLETVAGAVPHDAGAVADGAAPAPEHAQAELAAAEQEHRAAAARASKARDAREAASAALTAARGAAASAERLAAACRAEAGAAEQRVVLMRARDGDGRRRAGEITHLSAAANSRLERLAGLEREQRARLAMLAQEHARQRAAAEQSGAAILEAGARVRALKARLDALGGEFAHLRQRAEELDSQIAQDHDALRRAAAERADFEQELTTLAANDAAARERATELRAAVGGMRELCGRSAQAFEACRAEQKRAREALEALERETVECGLRREHARTLSEELLRNFGARFEADFSAESPALRAALEGRDSECDDARLSELRARAERIGEVNLAAESEVKELEERASRIGAERADLQSAVNDLSQTIHKLNREARRRFSETFEGAAKNFAELFPKLMRGGKARLELIEAADILDAGINILVQPPGKKVKEIGLLSGGEKALSAMALVFSLFLLNPSPFCVMDEVDAPLDEFSLAAFTALLGELKQRSQFIVVTHNQRTMQRADHIHGVTMERPGISRIISLKIPRAAA